MRYTGPLGRDFVKGSGVSGIVPTPFCSSIQMMALRSRVFLKCNTIPHVTEIIGNARTRHHTPHRSCGRNRRAVASTGLGSTGWLKSIRHGAAVMSGAPDRPGPLPWNANHLVFSVREPFPSRATQAGIVSGKITSQQPLIITSAMAENGVIFSDGMESDFLAFNAGVTATIKPLAAAGQIVVKAAAAPKRTKRASP